MLPHLSVAASSKRIGSPAATSIDDEPAVAAAINLDDASERAVIGGSDDDTLSVLRGSGCGCLCGCCAKRIFRAIPEINVTLTGGPTEIPLPQPNTDRTHGYTHALSQLFDQHLWE